MLYVCLGFGRDWGRWGVSSGGGMALGVGMGGEGVVVVVVWFWCLLRGVRVRAAGADEWRWGSVLRGHGRVTSAFLAITLDK